MYDHQNRLLTGAERGVAEAGHLTWNELLLKLRTDPAEKALWEEQTGEPWPFDENGEPIAELFARIDATEPEGATVVPEGEGEQGEGGQPEQAPSGVDGEGGGEATGVDEPPSETEPGGEDGEAEGGEGKGRKRGG